MSKLADEINNDPLGRGYSGMSDQEAADSINTLNIDRNRASMNGTEILAAIDMEEFAQVIGQPRLELLAFLGIDNLDPFGKAQEFFIGVFGAGSNTIRDLALVRVETISRAQELGAGFVKPGHVYNVRNV